MSVAIILLVLLAGLLHAVWNALVKGVATQTTCGGFTIQPNPNSGSFTVRGASGTGVDEEVTIEITDMLGQVVYREKTEAQNGKLNERIILGQKIANGMYLLNVRTAAGNNVFHVVVEE